MIFAKLTVGIRSWIDELIATEEVTWALTRDGRLVEAHSCTFQFSCSPPQVRAQVVWAVHGRKEGVLNSNHLKEH